jgi:synaptojanin
MSEGIFRIYQSEEEILIHNLLKSKLISIHKMDKINSSFTSPQISYKDINYLNSAIISQVFKAHGVLGVLKIATFEILLFISNNNKIGNIGNTEIYEIKEIDCILISQKEMKNFQNFQNSEEISLILENLKNLFKKGFYYSHNYDLTNSLQTQKITKINNNNRYDFIHDANSDFLWNFSLNKKFVENKIDNDFLVNLIYGYVGIINDYTINSTTHMQINYILISRRNNKNFSLKNFRPNPIDHEGNCSNFIETEAIVIQAQNVFSYVQVRGVTPVNLENFNFEERMKQMEKHIGRVLTERNFKLMFVINLLSNTKYEEQTLTDAFERLIQSMNLKNLKYSYFDLEKECNELMSEIRGMEDNGKEDLLGIFGEKNLKNSVYPNFNSNLKQDKRNTVNLSNNNNFQNFPNLSSPTHLAEENLENFLNKIESISSIFKFFGIFFTNLSNTSIANNTKQMWDQVGVIRTNCYNCLEKTNYIQMRVAWRVFGTQMKLINPSFDVKGLFGEISSHHSGIVNREGHSKSLPNKGKNYFKKMKNEKFYFFLK